MSPQDFIRLHGTKQFRHREELFQAIASNRCKFIAGDRPLLNREMFQVYRGRAKHLEQFSTPHALSLKSDCEFFCRSLEQKIEGKNRLWHFALDEVTYAVFEDAESALILGCIRGVDDRVIDDQKRKELWG